MGCDDHLTSLSSQNALSKPVDQGCSSSQLKKKYKKLYLTESLWCSFEKIQCWERPCLNTVVSILDLCNDYLKLSLAHQQLPPFI